VERRKGPSMEVGRKYLPQRTVRHKEEEILTGLTGFTGFDFIAPLGSESMKKL
jgi:hypothetical protein